MRYYLIISTKYLIIFFHKWWKWASIDFNTHYRLGKKKVGRREIGFVSTPLRLLDFLDIFVFPCVCVCVLTVFFSLFCSSGRRPEAVWSNNL